MKKDKIIYWAATILFAGFMISTAWPTEGGKAFIMQLGYPAYFVPLIGYAKIAGSIVILIPWFKKVKEWAYAGLCFDLCGAIYSLIMVHGFDPSMSIMFILLGVMAVSYIYNQKVNGGENSNN